jgi:hypothetical protein
MMVTVMGQVQTNSKRNFPHDNVFIHLFNTAVSNPAYTIQNQINDKAFY